MYNMYMLHVYNMYIYIYKTQKSITKFEYSYIIIMHGFY